MKSYLKCILQLNEITFRLFKLDETIDEWFCKTYYELRGY